jgi:hypothetical protein
MKSSCYIVFNHFVLLWPILYSINLHNSLRTRSILVLVLSSAEPSWTLFCDSFVSLTHSFSAMADHKWPSLSPINLRHGPHRKHLLFYSCLQFCCIALGMVWTTLKTSHVIAILPVHWHADCCLTTSYEHLFYCCMT